jgi:hypothetical protein
VGWPYLPALQAAYEGDWKPYRYKAILQILSKVNLMSDNKKTLEELFEQLELSSQKIHMERYIERHQLKPGSILHDAIYWAPDEKTFLIEAKAGDSEWSEAVAQLADLLIRK